VLQNVYGTRGAKELNRDGSSVEIESQKMIESTYMIKMKMRETKMVYLLNIFSS